MSPLTHSPPIKKRSAPSISAAEYKALVEKNLNGEFPVFALPPQTKQAKAPRMFPCQHPGCSYVGTTAALTRRHMGNIHGIGVERHPCDQPGCTYVGKWANHLKQHKQKAHNIDVTWHCCPVEGCGFKTKTTPALRSHMSARHEIGVVWHRCQMPGCNFECKERRNLFQHARWMHSGRTIVRAERALRNATPPLAEEENRAEAAPAVFSATFDDDYFANDSDEEWDELIAKARAARQAAARLGLLDPVCLPCAEE